MAPDLHAHGAHRRRCAVSTRRRGRRAEGMTLLELMVVVGILGILAAVATPLYISYLYRSKASEAVVILAEIRQQQESFHSIPGGRYANVSGTWDSWFPTADPGDTQVVWATATNAALGASWATFLGRASPQGYAQTYFSYETVAGAPGETPSSTVGAPDDRGYTGNDSWFIARALGDLDGDNENVTFEISSQSRNVACSHTAGWE